LLGFTVLNIKIPLFWALGPGLLSNFIGIILYGEMMPIQPEVMQKIIPGSSSGLWAVDARFLMTKDMVLPLTGTRLWFLDDRLTYHPG
jgi:hypothetical protein